MKKILAILLAMLMVTALTVAMAAESQSEITITKKYILQGDGNAKSPAETFTFSALECVNVTNAAEGVSTSNAPIPTIGNAAYAGPDDDIATTAGKEKEVTITLPAADAFPSVGVYTYQFTEVDNKTQGVTYNSDPIYLVVTVQLDDTDYSKYVIAGVHCEQPKEGYTFEDISNSDSESESKVDTFENTYTAGNLTVNKTVTGNLGDPTKYFDITVTFAPQSGNNLNSAITYIGGSKYTTEQTVSGNSVTISIKNGETVTFSNIPDGTTYTVTEADYTAEADGGYKEAAYTLNGEEADEISSNIEGTETDAVVITNNKDGQVDTGINMTTLPYIVIMALVIAGAAIMMLRRRNAAND